LHHKKNPLTWSEIIDFYLKNKEDRLTIGTLKNLNSTINYLKSAKVLDCQANTETVDTFIQYLQSKNYAGGTIITKVSEIKACYLYCKKKAKPLENAIFDLDGIEKGKRELFFKKAEWANFINEVKEQDFKHLFIVMLHTGARINELLTLTKDRVFLDSPTPHILIPAEFNKTKKEKKIPMLCQEEIDSLKYLINNSNNEFVVNKPLSTLNNKIKKYAELSGFKNWSKASAHMFRHTFLTWTETGEFDFLNGKPMSDRLRKFVVGHEVNSNITKDYTHFGLDNFFNLKNKE